ncbi:hypothetical protein DNU06_11230 [Putridiphycobacter roseus]|uniref:Outer membrane protein beta-barrel domain-containing protein n=1 Tax=Putridiphycobacter roseus TaxID=2219161 RepID=A0A2W1NMF0_9FLAO|nr:hypothetical protein [Putridiphycobacter roseus]PZE16822.1 hypothetical protein DNU06_11230 [Putridiphycobacter roseus]
MKYIYLILFCCFLSKQNYGQALEKNNLVLEFGMGYPPLSYFTSGSAFNNFGINKVINVGTFILEAEYFVSDKIGFEISTMYSFYQNVESLQFTQFDPVSGTSKSIDYDKIINKNRFKFLLGPNFHLYRTANLDTYLGLGFGINKSFQTIKYTETLPSAPDNAFDFFNLDTSPIAMRVSYGLRYFFSEYWAFKAEFGLGGPIINLSISTKLN